MLLSNKTDDTPTDGNSSQDSGEEAESDGTLSDNVADQADESESAESKEEEEAQEDQHSSENACRNLVNINNYFFNGERTEECDDCNVL